jgi:4-amino-4-deoxy-L-arabinose transferase-like glycosyltransferase
MKSVLLLVLLLLISSGFGRMLLRRCTVLSAAPLERFAYASAIGLGVGALGVFALGMLGQLSFLPITLLWTAMGLIGLWGTLENIRDGLQWAVRGRKSGVGPPRGGSVDLSYSSLIAPLTLLVLFLAALFCVCACFQPPSGHEWDVIAYHLADPKVFLSQHRITVLPTEHHSSFPFLMEMLYCVGLLYDGYPLANMLHLATGALTLIAVLGFSRRMFAGPTGWVAILLLATTPLYLWECCVAYIDVGLGLYITLAAFAGTMLIEAAQARPTQDGDSVAFAAARRRRMGEWAVLAGCALGFALGIKYLALLAFGALPLLLIYRRVPLRSVLTVVGVALLIGCPWYVKSFVLTHNPVYPFLFKLFPNSAYWSADRDVPYQSEQSGFGYSHSLAHPGITLSNLLQTPWRLTSTPLLYTNKHDPHFLALLGGLYAAGILSLLFLRKIPRPAVDLLLLFGSQFVAWFFVAQVVRYLISFLPLAAVLAACGLSAASRLGSTPASAASRNLRFFPTLVTLVVSGQVLLVGWAVWALPTSNAVAAQTGMMPTGLSVGDVLKSAAEPDTRADYLYRRLDVYAAMDWINHSTATTDGVVLYDEARGFYLDRPYLWGNRDHSAYIPYDQMKDGNDLTVWLHRHGYRYALINLNWSPNRPPSVSPNGRELELLRAWYVEAPQRGSWRFLLADAMREGLWTPTAQYGHGVVVVEIGEGNANAAGPGGRLP